MKDGAEWMVWVWVVERCDDGWLSCKIHECNEHRHIEGHMRDIQLLEWIQMGVRVDVDSRIAYRVENGLQALRFELGVLLKEAEGDLFETDRTGARFGAFG